jgi:hypothetical protein
MVCSPWPSGSKNWEVLQRPSWRLPASGLPMNGAPRRTSFGVSALYGGGLLIAAERNVWADHRARLEAGVVPRTTAPVVAQVSRSPQQVQLRRLLRGCDIVGFVPDQARSS